MVKTVFKNEPGEVWLPVVGYEGLYEVSNMGRVKSVKRSGTLGGLLSTRLTVKGYPQVAICKNNISKTPVIHRMVAKAFIPNPLNLPTVNHKDGDKQNNRVSNLEWMTYQENNKHGRDTGLINFLGGAKITEAQVLEIRSLGLVRYTPLSEKLKVCEKYGIKIRNLNTIIRGDIWKNVKVAALDGVIGQADGLLATPVEAPAQGHEADNSSEVAHP